MTSKIRKKGTSVLFFFRKIQKYLRISIKSCTFAPEMNEGTEEVSSFCLKLIVFDIDYDQ